MESIIGVVSDIEQAFQRARALINNSGRLSEKLNDPYVIDDAFFSLDDSEGQDSITDDEMFKNRKLPKLSPNRKSPSKSPNKSPRKAIKQLNSENNDLYVIHDPIVSLHDPETKDFFTNDENDESMSTNTNEADKIISLIRSPTKSPRKVDQEFSFEHMIDSPRQAAKSRTDLSSMPFLDNPIQNTINEMQKELNKRGDIALPIISQTTETISCLYNRDKGMYLLDREDTQGTKYLQKYDQGDSQQTNKRENHESKKLNTQKSKQDKKAEKKKKKVAKTDSTSSRENRMKELINIYGGGGKIGKPHSDSTLGSKSSNKLKNSSSRVNSSAPSKKSKKLKLPDKYSNDVNTDGFEGVEVCSRISSKRKCKQKDNNRLLKKSNLRRKIGAKLSNDNVDLKLSKNNQIHNRDINNNVNKFNRIHYIYNKHKNQSIDRIGDTNNIKLYSSNKIINPVSYTKHQYDVKSNFKYSQQSIQANKNCMPISKSSQMTNNEKVSIFLDKSVEDEKNNKVTVNAEVNVVKSNERMAEGDLLNDLLNNLTQKEFGTHVSQMHYTLPTHSSRMKEAGRFLHGSFQSFPFVIGQSTNKSHNLFVNIQETLSLMKQKLPATLEIETINAYDSERACSPTSVMSKMTMKTVMSKKQNQCPALGAGLYDIPEGPAETEEGAGRSWEDHPDCVKANVDPESVRPRCQCEPKATMSRKRVLTQVLGNKGESVVGMEGDVAGQDGDNYFRELRKTLMTFSQEFEDLNNKYEKMLKDPQTLKEDIERLELQLENKEEEIKEIIARIKEFKELSERGAAHLRQAEPDHFRSASTASFQLATLRRVQLLRDSLISRPSVPFLAKNVYTKHTLK